MIIGAEHWQVFAAGFVAAVMNSVAGGGTMVTFPALLAAGLPPVLANTTSTVALFAGMPGGVWACRRKLGEVKEWLWPLGIATFVGGGVGGGLLLWLPASVFEAIVPWLVLLATALFLLNGPLQAWTRRRAAARAAMDGEGSAAAAAEPARPSAWGVAFQSLVGAYGGYFGAGMGIMMLAGLGLLGLRDLRRMNAIKLFLGLVANVLCVGWFIFRGAVDWPLALALLAGSVPGYWVGSHFAQRIPQALVRALVVLTGIAIAVHLFWKR